MKEELFGYLKSRDVEYKTELDLSAYCTAKIGGAARVAVFPKNEKSITELIGYLRAESIKHRVVGGLSNTLVPDSGYDGVLIFTSLMKDFDISGKCVKLSCGCRIGNIIGRLADGGLSGLEPLAGIPGMVGGLVYNNAGAFSASVSDILTEARILDSQTGKIHTVSADRMHFDYRRSLLMEEKGAVLLSATFKLNSAPREKILADLSEYKERRRASQPLEYPSLGSVFKRPSSGFAGAYIEEAGLKGYSIGDAEISRKHAGFIINKGKARAEDFLALADYARDTVFKKFGVGLEREIEILD